LLYTWNKFTVLCFMYMNYSDIQTFSTFRHQNDNSDTFIFTGRQCHSLQPLVSFVDRSQCLLHFCSDVLVHIEPFKYEISSCFCSDFLPHIHLIYTDLHRIWKIPKLYHKAGVWHTHNDKLYICKYGINDSTLNATLNIQTIQSETISNKI
jgi:hypothetical protein